MATCPAIVPGTMPSESLVPVTVAAAQTGIPARTIRRWLERGQLAGHQTDDRGRLVDPAAVRALAVETGHPTALMWALNGQTLGGDGPMAAPAATMPGTMPASEPECTPGAGHLAGHVATGDPALGDLVQLLRERDQLVREKDQTILELAGRCGCLQSELQQTRARLEVAEETVRLLQAPAARSETVSEPVSDLPSDPAPAPTPNSPNYPAPSANGQDSGAQCPPRRPWWKFWA